MGQMGGHLGRSGSGKGYLKVLLIFVVGILVARALWGAVELKAPGKLVLDTMGNYKYFRGVIKITDRGITIECEKRIFQPYNAFDEPRIQQLFVEARALRKLKISKNNIYLYTRGKFYEKYRNYFLDIREGYILGGEDEAIVFSLDHRTAIDLDSLKQLLKAVKIEVF
ncbi:MAG: hypothetical protein GY765_42395 [bacterium]|nr:hypothetical protein [bacterium]